jgi:peptidoglycan/xylan/chitin deacetylase (PgdA/CDA1 family)
MIDLGMRRPPIARPNGARIAFSVTVALEAFQNACQYRHGPPGVATKPDYFSLSYAQYGLTTGVWRMMDLLEREQLRAAWSISGRAAELVPKTLKVISDAGHEMVGHGYLQDVAIPQDVESQAADIRKTLDAIGDATGQRPVGWTSQGSMGNENTLLAQDAVGGMLWNGDDASDDVPFVRKVGDRPYVIMPRNNFPANDLILWVKPTNAPSVLFESFKDAFDTLYEEGCNGSPKWIEVVMHSHFAGRATLIPTMRKVFAYVRQHQGVWYAQRRDIAKWTLEQELGKAAAAA